MNEMVFEGIQQLYDHLKTKGGLNPNVYGMVGAFYISMTQYIDPNGCKCKKGKNALNQIQGLYRRIPFSLNNQNAEKVRALFDNLPVVLKLDGAEVGRF